MSSPAWQRRRRNSRPMILIMIKEHSALVTATGPDGEPRTWRITMMAASRYMRPIEHKHARDAQRRARA